MNDDRFKEDEKRIIEIIQFFWRKKFIIILIMILSFIFILFYIQNRTVPNMYKGSSSFEVGYIQAKELKVYIPYDSRTLASYLEKKVPVKISLPRKSNNIIEVSIFSTDQEYITKILKETKNLIKERDEIFFSFYEEKNSNEFNIIKSTQIGKDNIKMINNQVNLKLVIGTSLIISFLLSLLIVFFIHFLQKLKRTKV